MGRTYKLGGISAVKTIKRLVQYLRENPNTLRELLASDDNPQNLGTKTPGTDVKFSRSDHVHENTFPTQTDGDNSLKAANTAYADGKIQDAINDAETSKAPSQNAVFDALALKFDISDLEDQVVDGVTNKAASQNAIYDELATRDTTIALKAPLASPTLTGTPQAPTPATGSEDTTIATTAFVLNKILAKVADLDIYQFQGTLNCSTNPNYPAADAGYIYVVPVGGGGKIGGASGVDTEAGDTWLCIVDSSASGDHATVGSNWVGGQANLNPSLYALLAGASFTGNVSIADGSLSMTGTDTYFAPPSLTTTEKNSLSPSERWMVWDETLKELQIYANGAWNSIGGGGGQVTNTQTSHGFEECQFIKCTGVNTYASAQADSAVNAEVVGIVALDIGTNTFIYQQNGKTTQLVADWNAACDENIPSGLTAGTVYYLSPTNAGQFTSTKPTADGQVIKPLGIGLNTTDMLILTYRGNELSDEYSGRTTIAYGDLSGGIFTWNHNLGSSIPVIAVYDTNGELNIPTVDVSSINQVTLDFGGSISSSLFPMTAVALVAGANVVYNISSSTPIASTESGSAGSSGDAADALHEHPHDNNQCQIYQNSVTTLTTNTYTTIDLQAAQVDSHGDMAEVVSDRIRIKNKGLYYIFGQIGYEANGTGVREGRIQVNGSRIVEDITHPSAGSIIHNRMSCIRVLNEDDLITLAGFQNTGSNLNTVVASTHTLLGVFLLRPLD